MKRIFAFFFIALAIGNTQAQLDWLHPKPFGLGMRFVQYMDANTIYTAGQAGVFMKSTDRGDTWKFNYQAGVPWYGIATRDVLCGQFLTKELGYLGGAVGMTKTTDGGNTFTNITPPGFPAASIFAIGFTDSLNGYVAGTGAYPFARTTDGGASWLQSSSAAPTTNRNMCVLNKNFIVVCGFPSNGKNIRLTTDGGETWNEQVAGAASNSVSAVYFKDTLNGFATDASSFYKTVDGGLNWSLMRTFPTTPIINNIVEKNGAIYLVGDPDKIFKTTDGGTTFTEYPLVSPAILPGFLGILNAHYRGDNWIAFGQSGVFYRSSNDGATWFSNSEVYKYNYIQDLYANSSTGQIIATGYPSKEGVLGQQFLISTNYGKTWFTKDAGRTLQNDVRQIKMVTPSIGYAAGSSGKVFRTTNGGVAWDSIAFTDANAINKLDFANENFGLALANNNKNWKTTDGGKNWTAYTFPNTNVSAIRFVDSATILAVRPLGNVYRSTDAGTTWQTANVTFPTAQPVGNIRMLNKKFGVIVGSSGASGVGYIYTTNDSGKSWASLPFSFNSTQLYDVAIRDTNDIIVCGQNGGLFRTTNSGASWLHILTGLSQSILALQLPHRDTLCFISNAGAASVQKLYLGQTVVTPTVKVLSPNGKEVWHAGSVQRITWSSTEVAKIHIDYSTNLGAGWNTVARGVNALTGFYEWVVPNTLSTQCLVRITDSTNAGLSDRSDAAFTIDPSPSSFWIPTPSGVTADIWGVDFAGAKDVWFVTTEGVVRRSTDGGETFIPAGSVGEPAYSIAALSDKAAIVGTGPSSGNGKILRTTDSGSTWTQVYTTAGAWWNFVTKIDSTKLWALSDPIGGTYHIVKSTDAGATWSVCPNLPVPPVGGYGAVCGYYGIGNTLWFGTGGLSGTSTTNRVYKSTNGPDGPWTYASTTLPNTGAIAFSNATGTGLVGFWNIAGYMNRSTDGGVSFSTITTTTSAAHSLDYIQGTATAYMACQTGIYKTTDDGNTWSVEQLPANFGGEPHFIRLRDGGKQGLAVGKAGFIARKLPVSSNSQIVLISPNSGEQYVAGNICKILWQLYTYNIATVKIEYSTNNGGTWIVVAPSVAAGTLSYSWTVPNTPSTATRVRITDAGNALVTDMSDTTFTIKQPDDADELNLPLEFALRQNYPNPFNPVTTINYEIPEDNIVTVKVYDILGAEKATLVNDFHKAGRYSITFDARQLASGVYFYTMNAGDFSSTRKFVIMK